MVIRLSKIYSGLSRAPFPMYRRKLSIGIPRWHTVQRRASSSNKKTTESINSTTQSKASFVSVGLAWYATKLDTHPITTKCTSSGLISATGDMMCQYLTMPTDGSEIETASWDYARTGRFAILGAFWVGPVLHYWYGSLALMSSKVWVRVAIDQFAFAPVTLTIFLGLLWLMEGDAPATLPLRLQENVPSVVVANWALWIPAQAVNFALLPVKYHVLFSNGVALIWNAYLSFSSYNSKRTDTQRDDN